MTTRILVAPSADLARTVANVEVTIEAEFGSVVIEGSRFTAAHHQPHLAHRPAPCNDTEIPVVTEGVILLSHVDLDSFGGALRALGEFPALFFSANQSFWALAQFVDLNGAHKLGKSGASEADLARLFAFWAWSKSAVPRLPRDAVSDVTDLVRKAGVALRDILDGDETLLAAGQAMRDAENDLNRRTFVRVEGSVIVRIAEVGRDFCNHLYTTPDGTPAKAVAAFNRESGSVTISLADPIPGVSCRAILQALWGPEAGGHDGIAGSPREKNMGVEGLEAAVRALSVALSA